MTAPWIVLVAIVVVAVVYVLVPVVVEAFVRFRVKRRFICPETGATAEVGIDAHRAAVAAAIGRPVLRVKTCSLWPERRGCGQTCLSRSEEAKPEATRPPVF